MLLIQSILGKVAYVIGRDLDTVLCAVYKKVSRKGRPPYNNLQFERQGEQFK